MRDLEFRVWKVDIQVMSDDFDLHELDCGLLIHQSISIGPNDVVLQYTGLKDKNGVKIFEGDIVNMPIDGEFYKTEIAFTVDRDFNGWEITDQHVEDGAEVVGNIYQNKELLTNA